MEAERIEPKEGEISKRILRLQKKLSKPRRCSPEKTENRGKELTRLRKVMAALNIPMFF